MTEKAKVEEDGRRIEAEVDLRLTKYLNAHAKDIEEEVQRRVAIALAKLEEELTKQMEEQLAEETARLKNWEVNLQGLDRLVLKLRILLQGSLDIKTVD